MLKDLTQKLAQAEAQAVQAAAEELARQIEQAQAEELAAQAAELEKRQAQAAQLAAGVEKELRVKLWDVWQLTEKYGFAAAGVGYPSAKAATLRRSVLQIMSLCGYDMQHTPSGQSPVKP